VDVPVGGGGGAAAAGVHLAAQAAGSTGVAVGGDGANIDATPADVIAEGAKPVPLGVELLDPVIAMVGDVDVACLIGGDATGLVHLAAQTAGRPALAVGGDGANPD